MDEIMESMINAQTCNLLPVPADKWDADAQRIIGAARCAGFIMSSEVNHLRRITALLPEATRLAIIELAGSVADGHIIIHSDEMDDVEGL